MNLGPLIDKLYETRQKRLDLQKQADALKAQEVEMRQEVLATLRSMGMEKGTGSLATCGITVSIDPVVTDWDEVHNFIRENDRFDLLQKRLSAPAWRGLLETGVLIPGTEQTMVMDVSLTKSSRS